MGKEAARVDSAGQCAKCNGGEDLKVGKKRFSAVSYLGHKLPWYWLRGQSVNTHTHEDRALRGGKKQKLGFQPFIHSLFTHYRLLITNPALCSVRLCSWQFTAQSGEMKQGYEITSEAKQLSSLKEGTRMSGVDGNKLPEDWNFKI